tara:strand:+ start:736 stop:927 length:192 start_codon:yes stop_codon:yes gene_type:complete
METITETPHRVSLKLDGADLVFTVLAKDTQEALKLVQELHPTASVLSAKSSDDILDGKVHQWI